MSNNLFLSHLPISAPWFHKLEPGKSVGDPQVFIRDQNDQPVCRINTRNPNAPRNRQLIEHAPQLLAALIEYAHVCHSDGIQVQHSLLTLIRESGGPDLSSMFSKT